MRHTRSHTANRRSHHALTSKRFVACQSCGALTLMHRACASCGKYKGRQVIDVMAKKAKLIKRKADAQKAKRGTAKAEEKEGEKAEKGS